MNDVTVYDLGSVDAAPTIGDVSGAVPHRAASHGASERNAGYQRTMLRPSPMAPRPAIDLAANVNLFVPGAERFVRGDAAAGLAILATLGLAVALGWAIVETLGRLTATFELFGISRGAALWSLGGAYGLAALTHVIAVVRAEPSAARAPHPVAAGMASAFVPGWGQVLNGDRARAALFIVLAWTVGATWLLASPAVTAMLDTGNLFLPEPLAVAASAGVRWTAAAVVWAIGVYDATQRATVRRAQEW